MKLIIQILSAVLIINFGSLFANDGLSLLSLPQSNYYGYCVNGLNPLSDQNNSPENTFYISYTNWLYDTQYTQFSYKNNRTVWSIKGLMSDNIDIRGLQPQDEAIGTTEYYNLALSAGHFYTLAHNELYLKASFLYEKLYYEGAAGWALDALYSFALPAGVNTFAGFSNLGRMNNLAEENTALPFKMLIGANKYLFKQLDITTILGSNKDFDIYIQGAAAWHYKSIASISASYSSYEESWHTGAIIHLDKYSFSIGKYFNNNGLEMPLMVSLTLH